MGDAIEVTSEDFHTAVTLLLFHDGDLQNALASRGIVIQTPVTEVLDQIDLLLDGHHDLSQGAANLLALGLLAAQSARLRR